MGQESDTLIDPSPGITFVQVNNHVLVQPVQPGQHESDLVTTGKIGQGRIASSGDSQCLAQIRVTSLFFDYQSFSKARERGSTERSRTRILE